MAAPVMDLKRPKADTSASQLYFSPETVWGETPPAPAGLTLKAIRYTGESLAHNKNTVQSNEIRSDAQITDLIEVGVAGEGDINIELSFGAHDDFLAALMRTDWVTFTSSTPITSITAAGSVYTIVGSSFPIAPATNALLRGMVIRLNGSSLNDGFYTLAADATGTSIVVVEALVAESTGTLTTAKVDTSNIRNGRVKKSFLLERQFTDLVGVTPASSGMFHHMRGARINTLTLNFTADSILTGTFGIMGDQMTVKDTSIGTVTPGPWPTGSDAPTNDVMNATANVGQITEGGTILNNAIQSLTLEVTNNCRSQRSIGSRSAVGIGYGRFVVTGTMNMYFESGVMFKKMIEHTASSWQAIVSDTGPTVADPANATTGRSYAFTVFKLKFASGGPEAGAPDTDVMQNLAYTAMRDPVTRVTLQICRFPTPT